MTDVGGGSGEMLEYILLLAGKILIHINEPDSHRRKKYTHKAGALPQVTIGQVISEPVQTAELPKSDIIIASHSLYYNAAEWSKGSIAVRAKFLDRMMASLHPEGAFCVILQSNAATGLKKQGGGELTNLENLEDAVYPLITAASESQSIDNRSRVTFANAEMFMELLSAYDAQPNKTQSLFWRSSPPIVSSVPIGKINFEPNSVTGMYDQSPEVTEIFNFYCRGLYSLESRKIRDSAPPRNFNF